MEKITLNVTRRDKVGKDSADKPRSEKTIPGILYTKGEGSVIVQTVEKGLQKAVAQAGTSTLVDLNLDGENKKILFREAQMHPFKNQILHFDVYAVNMKEKPRFSISVVLLNRDEIHAQPFALLQHLDEVEVECLPGSPPSTAEVDVQNSEIDGALFVKDLDVANEEGVGATTGLEEVVCALQELREEELLEEGERDAADAADAPIVDEAEEADEERVRNSLAKGVCN